MTVSTSVKSDLFTRAVAGLAILGPILLVAISGTLPEGSRGQLIVDGHVFIETALATALILRGVYALGFSHARKRLASSQTYPLTA
jgi:hypothetical protein